MTPARLVLASVAGFTAFAVARGDRRVVAYLLVVGAVGFALRRAHAVAPFPRALQWALAVAATLHLAGGLVPGDPVLYETWMIEGVVKYDQLVHFTTTATLTVVAHHVLGRWLVAPPALHAVLAALVATGLGAGNEVFEFLSALRFADAYVGGLENAGWDLVFNAFGSATAAVLLAAARGREAPWPRSKRTSTASPSPRRAPLPAAPPPAPPWRPDPTPAPEAAGPRT